MTVACPLCNRNDVTRLFESRDRVHGLSGLFTIQRCNSCHAIFIQPWLSNKELSAYYPDHYDGYRHSRSLDRKSYTKLRRFVMENYFNYPSSKKRSANVPKKWTAFLLSFVMAKRAVPYRGDGKFLDVGCGGGSYLYRVKQWGWDAYGVEPSKSGVKQARALELDVRHGELTDAKFSDSFFDVIRLNHVLEHLVDPQRTFLEIHRILMLEGVIYITVPNTRSFNFWLFNENWYGLDAPRHVISYCPKALAYLCRATGFEVVNISFRSGAFNFVRSVKYFLDEDGKHWPAWMRRIDWPRSKPIRRILKPFFLLVDLGQVGDVMVATLKKTSQ